MLSLSALAGFLIVTCSPVEKGKVAVSPWNVEGPTPHVIAHYMPWFEAQKGPNDPTRVWVHWKWQDTHVDHDPERRLPNGLRDIATVDYPLIGPYNSWDRNVMAYHLKTAKAAGIAAFIAIWYGPHSPTDLCIPGLLDEADKVGMRIAICYEEKINFPPYRRTAQREEMLDNVRTDLQYIVDQYGKHPAYLKRNGVPFIAQFNGWGVGRQGPNFLTSAEWRIVLPQVHPTPVYCRQNLQPEYHPPIDSAYIWCTIDSEQKSFVEQAQDFVSKGRLAFFMTMACPGFDDSGVYGWGGGIRRTPREGLSVFEKTLNDGLDANPELLQLVTWNDFNEGTTLEPTLSYGFRYLDALALALKERYGRPANLKAIRAPYREYVQHALPSAKAEIPEASTVR